MSTNTTAAGAPRHTRRSGQTPRASVRLRVRLRRERIDRDLADNARMHNRSEEHTLRAAQLTSEEIVARSRARCAKS